MAPVMLIEGDLLMRRRMRRIIDVNRGLHVVAEADSAADAVRRAAAGESYPSSSLRSAEEAIPPASVAKSEPRADPYEFLTSRERQILALLAAGKLQKQIAAILGRSVTTIRYHHARILDKLRVRSDLELGRFLARHGPPNFPAAAPQQLPPSPLETTSPGSAPDPSRPSIIGKPAPGSGCSQTD